MYQISPSPQLDLQLEYKSLMARISYRCGIVTVTANAVEQVTHTAAAVFIHSINHTNLFGGTFQISSMCLFQLWL